jgi:hypothetical protein
MSFSEIAVNSLLFIGLRFGLVFELIIALDKL